ncbi:hypothetical protein [Chitinophaga japonensis]|uniref:DUF4890 domain-containing protein n=1 Tax=Chitinophaga japonensis TaxID=104662 RepID=A0A562T5Y4_CHIJA|nr:hypothetical protein [Chitinophaga japonensis]TWI88935.1 hypothetical protein LX66_3025 [Chitinophaga japonensis]
MKNRIFLALAFLLAGHMTIQAQGGMQRRTVEERVKMTMDKMTPELSLKEDQQTKFSEAYTEFYKSMDKMRQEARESGNRPDRSAFKKLMDDRDAKIKGFLSEDQYTKYTAAMEEMRKDRGGRGGGGRQR